MRFEAILREICESPEPDGRVKLEFESAPERTVIYHDGTYWVTYHYINNWTLLIDGMGTVRDRTEP